MKPRPAAVDEEVRQDEALARQILGHHSKSFALAARLLPSRCRADAALLYAWCRRCDDAVDQPNDRAMRAAAVERLRVELDEVYGVDGAAPTIVSEPVLRGFRSVVRRHDLPRRWAEDLLDGMAMDIEPVRYETVDALLLYAYRAAGTVGLMMAHLMGARRPEALRRAADLGIAMQLTNICRDVAEDAGRGRVYLPAAWLSPPRPDQPSARTTPAVKELLSRADAFYASGRAGLACLPLGCAIGVHAAALIYREIGRELARRGFDVTAGRAIVSHRRKLALVLRAVVATVPIVVWRRWLWRGAVSLPALSFALPIGAESAR